MHRYPLNIAGIGHRGAVKVLEKLYTVGGVCSGGAVVGRRPTSVSEKQACCGPNGLFLRWRNAARGGGCY